jgi:hypothetical protein
MFYHPILSNIDIIRDTIEPKHLGFSITDSIAGSGVTIPGLTHTARIDNQPPFTEDKPNIRRERTEGASATLAVLKHQRHMRMADKTILRLKMSKILPGAAD